VVKGKGKRVWGESNVYHLVPVWWWAFGARRHGELSCAYAVVCAHSVSWIPPFLQITRSSRAQIAVRGGDQPVLDPSSMILYPHSVSAIVCIMPCIGNPLVATRETLLQCIAEPDRDGA
jgi:hypothetical protein